MGRSSCSATQTLFRIGKRLGERSVERLDDGASELLARPYAFRLAVIDIADVLIAERVIVAGVDHHHIGWHVGEEAGDFWDLSERDRKDDNVDVLGRL